MSNQKPAGHQGVQQIKKMVDLVKKVNCQNYALISEVAKEMGMKKTAVMQFVDDNPKLFTLVEVKKKDKVLGLGIRTVYTDPNQNPDTEEWMTVQKVFWNQKLHVGEWTYYGQHEFWYFPEELSNSKESQYRNTFLKLNQLEEMGILKKTTQCYGGFGDSGRADVYLCNKEVLDKLAYAGWTTDFQEVSAASKS